jgi:hypothetical protein
MSHASDPPGPDDPWAPPSAPAGQPAYGYDQGYPPGLGHGYSPYGPYGYQRPTNGKAVAALWTGIAALVLTFCCGGGVLGIVPIVLGAKARGEIRRSGGQQGGDGMALAGIITGAVAVVLSLAVIALIVGLLASGVGSFSTTTGTDV